MPPKISTVELITVYIVIGLWKLLYNFCHLFMSTVKIFITFLKKRVQVILDGVGISLYYKRVFLPSAIS